MSMTERRESRERLGRLANRNHSPCHTNHTMALNPYPLTPAPPYGRRRGRPLSNRKVPKGAALVARLLPAGRYYAARLPSGWGFDSHQEKDCSWSERSGVW